MSTKLRSQRERVGATRLSVVARDPALLSFVDGPRVGLAGSGPRLGLVNLLQACLLDCGAACGNARRRERNLEEETHSPSRPPRPGDLLGATESLRPTGREKPECEPRKAGPISRRRIRLSSSRVGMASGKTTECCLLIRRGSRTRCRISKRILKRDFISRPWARRRMTTNVFHRQVPTAGSHCLPLRTPLVNRQSFILPRAPGTAIADPVHSPHIAVASRGLFLVNQGCSSAPRAWLQGGSLARVACAGNKGMECHESRGGFAGTSSKHLPQAGSMGIRVEAATTVGQLHSRRAGASSSRCCGQIARDKVRRD